MYEAARRQYQIKIIPLSVMANDVSFYRVQGAGCRGRWQGQVAGCGGRGRGRGRGRVQGAGCRVQELQGAGAGAGCRIRGKPEVIKLQKYG